MHPECLFSLILGYSGTPLLNINRQTLSVQTSRIRAPYPKTLIKFNCPLYAPQFGQISHLLPVNEKDRKLRKHPPVAGEITEMVPALTCKDG
jgi:hypothetical protein